MEVITIDEKPLKLNRFYVAINGGEFQEIFATFEDKLDFSFVATEGRGSCLMFNLKDDSYVEMKFIKEKNNGNTEG